IEGGYAGGYEYPISGSDSSLGTGSATSEVSGFNIAAVGILPLSDRFSLQGKAGIFYWDQDVKVSASGFSGEINESGTSPMFGVGGTFNFTQRLGILVEYSRLLDVGEKNVTGETDVDVFSASLVVNF
ncbi:MAG: hypothetical protein GTO41_03050, partial [Burkholderiales bacterium]|nr:hypothetical protein [Burkholderiales bacterium]